MCFHRVLLFMCRKSSGKNNANNCREKFFHTNKCNYMSLNVGIEFPVLKERDIVFHALFQTPDLI